MSVSLMEIFVVRDDVDDEVLRVEPRGAEDDETVAVMLVAGDADPVPLDAEEARALANYLTRHADAVAKKRSRG